MHCAGEAGSIHAPSCERWEGDWFRQMCQPHLTDGTLTSLAASGAKPTVRISFDYVRELEGFLTPLDDEHSRPCSIWTSRETWQRSLVAKQSMLTHVPPTDDIR